MNKELEKELERLQFRKKFYDIIGLTEYKFTNGFTEFEVNETDGIVTISETNRKFLSQEELIQKLKSIK